MDEFEKYIKDHKSDLDTEEPNRAFLWDNIQIETLKKKHKRETLIWRVAAVILALTVIGQLTFMINRSSADKPAENIAVEQNSGSFNALEQHYLEELNDLQQRVDKKEINPAEYTVLYEELSYINELESEFKTDIPLANDKERIAEILVDTYEKKIKLLERLLEQVERKEQEEEQFKSL